MDSTLQLYSLVPSWIVFFLGIILSYYGLHNGRKHNERLYNERVRNEKVRNEIINDNKRLLLYTGIISFIIMILGFLLILLFSRFMGLIH